MGVNVLIKRFNIGKQLSEVRQDNVCAIEGGLLSHDDLLLIPGDG
jgi:hypothetical protein